MAHPENVATPATPPRDARHHLLTKSPEVLSASGQSPPAPDPRTQLRACTPKRHRPTSERDSGHEGPPRSALHNRPEPCLLGARCAPRTLVSQPCGTPRERGDPRGAWACTRECTEPPLVDPRSAPTGSLGTSLAPPPLGQPGVLRVCISDPPKVVLDLPPQAFRAPSACNHPPGPRRAQPDVPRVCFTDPPKVVSDLPPQAFRAPRVQQPPWLAAPPACTCGRHHGAQGSPRLTPPGASSPRRQPQASPSWHDRPRTTTPPSTLTHRPPA